MEQQFDQLDPLSIECYGKKLEGTTLGNHAATIDIKVSDKSRGRFGSLLEYYFNIKPNNLSRPDFEKAGVELKASPVVEGKNGKITVKERLVLSMIPYMEVHKEEFEHSSFLSKNKLLLFVWYLFQYGVLPHNYVVKLVRLWGIPENDLQIIKEDWEKIVNKIREGKAHELSGGDTLYLEACTKGADGSVRVSQPFSSETAKPRAFAFKRAYIDLVYHGYSSKDSESLLINKKDKKQTFEEYVIDKFNPYIGKSIDEIQKIVNVTSSKKAKSYTADITRGILGVKKKKIEEFEKAGVVMKTIRLKKSGMPKESMSFPAIKFKNLVNEKWEGDESTGEMGSTLRQSFSQRFLFVIYQYGKRVDDKDILYLKKATFWTMPVKDLDGPVRKMWEKFVENVRISDMTKIPGARDNGISHVRPHGRNSKDVDVLPNGVKYPKQAFWLNQSYLRDMVVDNN